MVIFILKLLFVRYLACYFCSLWIFNSVCGAMKTKTRHQSLTWMCLAFITASFVLVEVDAGKARHRRAQRDSESSPDRIKKGLWIAAAFLAIALVPLLLRFVHALMTDAVIPMLWKEGKARVRRCFTERFGKSNNDYGPVEVQVDSGEYKKSHTKHE